MLNHSRRRSAPAPSLYSTTWLFVLMEMPPDSGAVSSKYQHHILLLSVALWNHAYLGQTPQGWFSPKTAWFLVIRLRSQMKTTSVRSLLSRVGSLLRLPLLSARSLSESVELWPPHPWKENFPTSPLSLISTLSARTSRTARPSE